MSQRTGWESGVATLFSNHTLRKSVSSSSTQQITPWGCTSSIPRYHSPPAAAAAAAANTSHRLIPTTLLTVAHFHPHRSSSCCDSGSDSDSSYSSNSSQKGSWANLEGRRWTHPEKPHHPHHRLRAPPGLGQVAEEAEGSFFDVQLQVGVLLSASGVTPWFVVLLVLDCFWGWWASIIH